MRILTSALTLVLVVHVSAIGAATLQLSKGKTEFLAIGRPSALKIAGKGAGPTGEMSLEKSADGFVLHGVATMDLSSFETGIGMRDRHMKEKYLETEKFNQAKLSFADVKIPTAVLKAGGTVKAAGTLDLHGVQKPVDVEMTVSTQGSDIATTSKFKIKLSDFSISIPKFSGITVADEVEVTAHTQVAFPMKDVAGL